MEKKGVISEFCIKAIYAIIAMLGIGFLIYDLIVVFPLFKALSLNEQEFYNYIFNSRFGLIYADIGIVETIDDFVFKKAIIAFLNHLNWLEVFFCFSSLVLLFVYFIFIKWRFVASYLKISLYICLTHLLKYLINGIFILIFYNGEVFSLQKAIFIGNIFYVLFGLLELFLLCLWIIKFIFNFEEDIKQIHLLNNE